MTDRYEMIVSNNNDYLSLQDAILLIKVLFKNQVQSCQTT